jgi:purine-binding chemotaxis protein CheW
MAADASERDDGSDAPERTVQVVEFTLGGERYALDVSDVDSIVDLEGATRVPRTSEAIDGVMDLRGEITAVIDPRAYLDVDQDSVSMEQQVLVIDQDRDSQKIGLRVDRVVGVGEYAEGLVDTSDAYQELDTTGIREQTIRSIIRRPTGDDDFDPVAWLDVGAIIEQSRQSTGVIGTE